MSSENSKQITMGDIKSELKPLFAALDPDSSIPLRERQYEIVLAELVKLMEKYDQAYKDRPRRDQRGAVAESLIENNRRQILLTRLLNELEF